MTNPAHLDEDDYLKAFPQDLDAFPTPVNDEHYIDAWLFNTLFASLLATEQYLIDHKDNIEAPIGDNVLGEDGQLEVSIPPARYPDYKSAMAWDSNLLEENIVSGKTIFGIAGAAVSGAGGVGITTPTFLVIAEDIVNITPPGVSMDTSRIITTLPTVTSP